MKEIPVSIPALDEAETETILKALKDKAISGFFGEYLEQFDREFAAFCGTAYAVGVSSGTAAIHLALASIGVKPGDEVIVSTLTNMATFFPVLHLGAKPVPVDIEPDTLNIDPELVESKITEKTVAIIVVHLFGHPVNMDAIVDLCKKHNLVLIEDAAEAHGAEYNGKRVGGIGHIGCFSFYANKLITTGEGGSLVTNDPLIATRARSLKSLAFGDTNKFMHKYIGYNFRMTNLQSAIGVAQMTKADAIVEDRRRIARDYALRLEGLEEYLILPVEKDYAKNVYWMYHIVLKKPHDRQRSRIMQDLQRSGVQTREGFVPYNLQEIFINEGLTTPDECPLARDVAYSSFYLPTYYGLPEADLDYICEHVREVLKEY